MQTGPDKMGHLGMNTPYVFPRSCRVLAPAGGFASPLALLRQFLRNCSLDECEQFLVQSFGAQRAVVFSSGKHALFALFQALRKRTTLPNIGMSAYTCPDIAAAALRAGFKVFPLEIEAKTLELNVSLLHKGREDLAAVVLSNLYGLADSLANLKEALQGTKCFVIDDGCQSALSRTEEGWLGARLGTIGVLSFGRGKAICGTGGGALVFAHGTGPDAELISPAGTMPDGISHSSLEITKQFVLSVAMWMLEHPLLYRIPASVPLLKLGATAPTLEFSCSSCLPLHAIQAVIQLKAREKTRDLLLARARQWHEQLRNTSRIRPLIEPFIERGCTFAGSVVPIRYPVVFSDSHTRDMVWRRLQEQGLGASLSYPALLAEYPEISRGVVENPTPVAKNIAQRILTLPVHRYVRTSDIERGSRLFGEADLL